MRRYSAGDRDSIESAILPSYASLGALDRTVLPSTVRDTPAAATPSRVQPSASRGVRLTSLHSVLLGAACVHALALIIWNLSAHRGTLDHSSVVSSTPGGASRPSERLGAPASPTSKAFFHDKQQHPAAWDWVDGEVRGWDDGTATLALRSYFYDELGIMCNQKNAKEVAHLARSMLASGASREDWCSPVWHKELQALDVSQLYGRVLQAVPPGGGWRNSHDELKYYAPPSQLGSGHANSVVMDEHVARASSRCLEAAYDDAVTVLADGLLGAFGPPDELWDCFQSLLRPSLYPKLVSSPVHLRDLEAAALAMESPEALDLPLTNFPPEITTALACIRWRALAPSHVADFLLGANFGQQSSMSAPDVVSPYLAASCEGSVAFTRSLASSLRSQEDVSAAVEAAVKATLLRLVGRNVEATTAPPSSSCGSSAAAVLLESHSGSTLWHLSPQALGLTEALQRRASQTSSDMRAAADKTSTLAQRMELRRRFYFPGGSQQPCALAEAWASTLGLNPVKEPPLRRGLATGHSGGSKDSSAGRSLILLEPVPTKPDVCAVRDWTNLTAEPQPHVPLTPSLPFAGSSLVARGSIKSPLNYSNFEWYGQAPPIRQVSDAAGLPFDPDISNQIGSSSEDRSAPVAIVVPCRFNELDLVTEWLTTAWPRSSRSSSSSGGGGGGGGNSGISINVDGTLRCAVPVVFVTSSDWATNVERHKQFNPEKPTFIELVSRVFEPDCVDISSRSAAASHTSSHRSSSSSSGGGVYFLSLHLPERLNPDDATAATFYASFKALDSSFMAFQWMERGLLLLKENWAERIDFLVTGHDRHQHHLQQQHMSDSIEKAKVPSGGAASSTKRDRSPFAAHGSAPEWSELRGQACADWWQVGSPPLSNPSTQSAEMKSTTASFKGDLRINGNALYALRCPAFDEYRTLVLIT